VTLVSDKIPFVTKQSFSNAKDIRRIETNYVNAG